MNNKIGSYSNKWLHHTIYYCKCKLQYLVPIICDMFPAISHNKYWQPIHKNGFFNWYELFTESVPA